MRTPSFLHRFFSVSLSVLFPFWLISAGPATAQTRATITGTLATATNTPIEFATITLHRATDSVVVKSEFSDAQGHFQLEVPSGVSYRVSAAQVGFER